MPRIDETPAALPGTIILTTIPGLTGFFIGLGQWLSGDASRFHHAGVCDGAGGVIEAAPGGVRRVPVKTYLDGRPIAYGWMITMPIQQRERIVIAAADLEGTPYSWLTYIWLGLARLGLHPRWIRDRIARNDALICSALCDLAYARGGLPIFQDGRLPGDCTPGDLANAFIERQDWSATPAPPVTS